MNFAEKKELVAEANEEALLADGFEDALVGVVRIFNKTLALYDRKKCVAILRKRDKMTEEDAEEYLEFNVHGAWMGEGTPAFASFFKDLDR